jgi:sugar lactone lactonase YvrE
MSPNRSRKAKLVGVNLTLALLCASALVQSQDVPTITTVAGGGPIDNGPATKSAVGFPSNVAVDGQGNFFISDLDHDVVRKIDSNGIITTVAGNGIAGFSGDGGPATEAHLNFPLGLAVDKNGNLYLADVANNRIRKVDSNGIITTFAGNGSVGLSGDGGPAASASLALIDQNIGLGSPYLATDTEGNLFITDSFNYRIRKVDTQGVIKTFAGSTSGFSGDGGPAINAQFSFLTGITVDGTGNIFISDGGNGRIRKVDTNGNISTIAGIGLSSFLGDGGPAVNAALNSPSGLAIDSNGNLLIADATNERIRRVDSRGIINTVAGNGTQGFGGDGGPAIDAALFSPGDVAADSLGNFFIADGHNDRIRKVDGSDTITTVAGTGLPNFSGDGGPAIKALLDQPAGVAADSAGNVFISDTNNYRLRKIDSSGNISTLVAGQNHEFISNFIPLGLSLDSGGNIFVSEISENVLLGYYEYPVQELSTTGNLSTVAMLAGTGDVAVTKQGIWAIANGCIQKLVLGQGVTVAGVCGVKPGFGGDGGPATSAFLDAPSGLAVDDLGEIFISETNDARIRKVDASGIINTIVGNGSVGFSGDGGPALSAQLDAPAGVRLSRGSIYFADTINNRIRKVDASGIITTVAGNGTAGFSGDGGPATSANLNSPLAIGLDRNGDLLIADTGNSRIRKVTLSDFTLFADPATPNVRQGQTANVTLTLTPRNGFEGSISFACSGLPIFASCAFNPPSVTPNGSPVDVSLKISTAGPNAALHVLGSQLGLKDHVPALALWTVNGLLGTLGLVVAGSRKQSRMPYMPILVTLGIVFAFAIVGCGGNGAATLTPGPTPTPIPTTPAGSSTVTVTATSNEGSIFAAINLTVTQ